jgi:hypothetical protein
VGQLYLALLHDPDELDGATDTQKAGPRLDPIHPDRRRQLGDLLGREREQVTPTLVAGHPGRVPEHVHARINRDLLCGLPKSVLRDTVRTSSSPSVVPTFRERPEEERQVRLGPADPVGPSLRLRFRNRDKKRESGLTSSLSVRNDWVSTTPS